MQTPQELYPKLAESLGFSGDLWLKREDLHPYGSHKGRSIPCMINTYTDENHISNFVISSSGNAALSAINTVLDHNTSNSDSTLILTVFVGKRISKEKFSILNTLAKKDLKNIRIIQVERPKQEALKMEKNGTAKNLRQSTDDLALVGYESLAQELLEIPNLSTVFVPTSSGTTAQGLAQAFFMANCKVQVHIVQTTACHPISGQFDTTEKTETSLASAIVDNVAHRKEKVLELITRSGGYGWTITDSEIKDILSITKEKLLFTVSPNSALSLAGLVKALQEGWTFNGAVACLLTGL